MKSYRTLIATLVILLLLLVGGWGFLVSGTSRAAGQLAQNELALAGETQAQSEQAVLKRQLEETQQARIKLNSYFVNEEALVSFIEQLEALGRETGAVVEVVGATNDATISLEIRINGSFAAVFRTMELIEKIPYALTVERANISTSEEGWGGKLTIKLIPLQTNE